MLSHDFDTVTVWILYESNISDHIYKSLVQRLRRVRRQPIYRSRNVLTLILQKLYSRIFQPLQRFLIMGYRNPYMRKPVTRSIPRRQLPSILLSTPPSRLSGVHEHE